MKTSLRLCATFGLVAVMMMGCGKKAAPISSAGENLFQSADPQIKADWDMAIAAAKTNGYVTAILTLKQLQRETNLTPEQAKAVTETLTALNDQMFKAAGKGDPNAKQAVEQLQKLIKHR